MNSQKATDISSLRTSYGASFPSYLEGSYLKISNVHCNWQCVEDARSKTSSYWIHLQYIQRIMDKVHTWVCFAMFK